MTDSNSTPQEGRYVSKRPKRALRITLGIYLLALAWIVFAPGDDAERVTGIVGTFATWLTGWTPLTFDQAYVPLEFLANVALFVPFGVLWILALHRPRPLLVIALGLATTITIELAQFALPSRYSTISDVIANTLGAVLGVALVRLFIRRRA